MLVISILIFYIIISAFVLLYMCYIRLLQLGADGVTLHVLHVLLREFDGE